MVYTPEEKKKMDNVLAVFAEYTAKHPEFDVAYSDKTGYVRLIVAEFADAYFFPLKDFDDLVDMFCMQIVFDKVYSQVDKDPNMRNWDVDYDSIRSDLQVYINRLDEAYQEQAANVANRHIINRAMSPYLQ